MTQIEALITVLSEGEVRFVIIGGLAAVAHGVAYVTNDVDLCYERTPENLAAVVRVLRPLQPALRLQDGETVPFLFDERTLHNGLNFTLETTLGPIDLLGEVQGAGNYASLATRADTMDLFGHHCLVIALEDLIRAKRSAGRTKDLLVLQELEAIRDMRAHPPGKK